jgi:hypothetical protein
MMSSNERPPDSSPEGVPGTVRIPLSNEMKRTLKSVGDFIERAREHHARTGEWPPDPLLDEIDEMRRRVQAEHGNDPWKLLAYYNQAGRGLLEQNGGAPDAEERDASAA